MGGRNRTPGSRHVAATFDLVDHDGRAVTERSYRGKRVLVFFGFTNCKMVCPRALGRLSAVLDRLEPRADAFAALYITVDPERDTPAVMKAFLTERFPRFTGLTGEPQQVADARSSFRVFARKVADPDDPDGYQMPHSAFTYVLDEEGSYLTHVTDAVGEDELADLLSEL
jgi:protein SCO1/2